MGVFGGRTSTSFKPGHKPAPRKSITTRQQRKATYAACLVLNARMSASIAAGEEVDALLFQRGLHLQMMLEKKGYAR
jgi:hypothetical protein